jgi:hypothetical protein
MLSLHAPGLLLLAVVFFARVAVALEGAAPHLFRPMYAGANMGHPSREEGFALCSNHSADDELHPGCCLTSAYDCTLQLRRTCGGQLITGLPGIL